MYLFVGKAAHKWKLILPLVVGGAVIGVTIWWFRRRSILKSPQPLTSNDEADMEPVDSLIVSHHRLVSYRSTASIASHNSTISCRRSVRDPGHWHLSPSHYLIDSDPDDGSSACLDHRKLGISALAGVVDHLESLMSKVRMCEEKGMVAPSRDAEQLIDDLRVLLEHAYKLREQYKLNFVIHDQDFGEEDLDIGSEDETCSYFSASEELDLSDLEIIMSQNVQNPIYYKALKMLDGGEILYRSLRTEFVGCKLDIEYLAKVHCLRQAFDFIFARPEPTTWLASLGKLTVFRLLHCLGYPLTDFKEAYERLIEFVLSQRNKPNSMMIEELTAKGVKVINFYDVLFDLMLLEAFELLTNPPDVVLSVTRHRWLSDNFKRCALDSTVWTIIMAKRKLLKFPDGFYAHYYSVMGTILPALAWGFLGPDENSNRICNRFREIIMDFVCESFVCHDQRQLDSANMVPDISAVEETIIPNTSLHSINPPNSDSPNHITHTSNLNGKAVVHEDVAVDGDEDIGDPDNDDDCGDSSTPVNSLDEDHSLPSNVMSNERPKGLRYTILPELATDLYERVLFYSIRLKDMFLEESDKLNNPLPTELANDPAQPPLRYPIS